MNSPLQLVLRAVSVSQRDGREFLWTCVSSLCVIFVCVWQLTAMWLKSWYAHYIILYIDTHQHLLLWSANCFSTPFSRYHSVKSVRFNRLNWSDFWPVTWDGSSRIICHPHVWIRLHATSLSASKRLLLTGRGRAEPDLRPASGVFRSVSFFIGHLELISDSWSVSRPVWPVCVCVCDRISCECYFSVCIVARIVCPKILQTASKN